MRLFAVALFFVGLSVSASAAFNTYETPEIDFNSGVSAVALLSGALLTIRARRPK
jgi:hypothetical protein